MKFGIVLTFILFGIYAILDHYAFPDYAQQLFQIRAIEGIFLISLFSLLNFKKEFFIQHLHIFSSILTIGTGIILLWISSFYPDDNLVYVLYDAGFVLYITAVFTVFGNHFISALLVVSIIDICIGFIFYNQLEFVPLLFLQSLFFSTILLSGFGAYITEYNQRKLFLEHLYSKKMEERVQQYIHKLEKLSVTDKLTGLYNRVKLERELKRVMSEFQRYQTPCSVILLDIDHFKAVNDTYGHLEGDNVLIKVAQILQKHSRKTDIAGRWGGEEFLIVTPNTTLKQAAVLAEKLRYKIEETSFGAVGHKTVSIGVSTFAANLTTNEIIDKADQALYKAKNSGRNRVVLSEYEIA